MEAVAKLEDGPPSPSFSNIHINATFRAKEGCAPIIVEIQVHHKEVMRLGGKDHKLYEIKRAKTIKDLL